MDVYFKPSLPRLGPSNSVCSTFLRLSSERSRRSDVATFPKSSGPYYCIRGAVSPGNAQLRINGGKSHTGRSSATGNQDYRLLTGCNTANSTVDSKNVSTFPKTFCIQKTGGAGGLNSLACDCDVVSGIRLSSSQSALSPGIPFEKTSTTWEYGFGCQVSRSLAFRIISATTR
jgi:hypothetical protein